MDKLKNTFNISMPDNYAKFLLEWHEKSQIPVSEIIRRLIDFYRENNPSKS